MRLNTIMLAITWLALLAGSQLLGHRVDDAELIKVSTNWHVGNVRHVP